MKTLLQIRAEIAELQREEQKLLKMERAEHVKQVIAIVQKYNITWEEIVGGTESKYKGHPGVKGKRPIKYKGPNGEEWSGYSRVPKWLAKHIENGGSRDDFLIQ